MWYPCCCRGCVLIETWIHWRDGWRLVKRFGDGSGLVYPYYAYQFGIPAILPETEQCVAHGPVLQTMFETVPADVVQSLAWEPAGVRSEGFRRGAAGDYGQAVTFWVDPVSTTSTTPLMALSDAPEVTADAGASLYGLTYRQTVASFGTDAEARETVTFAAALPADGYGHAATVGDWLYLAWRSGSEVGVRYAQVAAIDGLVVSLTAGSGSGALPAGSFDAAYGAKEGNRFTISLKFASPTYYSVAWEAEGKDVLVYDTTSAHWHEGTAAQSSTAVEFPAEAAADRWSVGATVDLFWYSNYYAVRQRIGCTVLAVRGSAALLLSGGAGDGIASDNTRPHWLSDDRRSTTLLYAGTGRAFYEQPASPVTLGTDCLVVADDASFWQEPSPIESHQQLLRLSGGTLGVLPEEGAALALADYRDWQWSGTWQWFSTALLSPGWYQLKGFGSDGSLVSCDTDGRFLMYETTDRREIQVAWNPIDLGDGKFEPGDVVRLYLFNEDESSDCYLEYEIGFLWWDYPGTGNYITHPGTIRLYTAEGLFETKTGVGGVPTSVCVWQEEGDDDYCQIAVHGVTHSGAQVRFSRVPVADLPGNRFGIGGAPASPSRPDADGEPTCFGFYAGEATYNPATGEETGAEAVRKAETGDCPTCTRNCTHCFEDRKPACLEATLSGVADLSTSGVVPCESCECWNRVWYLTGGEGGGAGCEWSGNVWHNQCETPLAYFNRTWTMSTCKDLVAWVEEVDGTYRLVAELRYSTYVYARWIAELGDTSGQSGKPDCMAFDETLYYDDSSGVAYDSATPWDPDCDFTDSTLRLRSLDSLDQCDNGDIQHPYCDDCGGSTPDRFRVTLSGFVDDENAEWSVLNGVYYLQKQDWGCFPGYTRWVYVFDTPPLDGVEVLALYLGDYYGGGPEIRVSLEMQPGVVGGTSEKVYWRGSVGPRPVACDAISLSLSPGTCAYGWPCYPYYSPGGPYVLTCEVQSA